MARLRSIAFSNYKAFADEQVLEVRPITLLFGHNSVGKSAALRLLPILAQAARPRPQSSYSPTVLDYTTPALRGAGPREIASWSSKAPAIAFTLDWEIGRFSVTLRQVGASNPVGRHELASDFSISLGEDRLDATLIDPDRETFDLADEKAVQIPFEGLRPHLPNPLAQRFQPVLEALDDFSGSVRWLTAVRAQPPRRFSLEAGGSAEIGPDGSGTAEALRISALRGDGVAEAVSKWLGTACGCELTFAATDAEVVFGRQWFPFQIRTSGGAVAVPDVGEGVAQALPVVTLCRQAAVGLLGDYPVLALEQPELHLHPKAAAALAEEVVACVAEGSRAAHVIETHSEHFLLALQVALLRGRLTSDQLLIYWVANDGEGAQLRRIEFDKEGFPTEGWPEGVFREALEQARRIAELRINK